MTSAQFLEKHFHAKNLYDSINKLPCAEDGKSFFYLSAPFNGVYCWANDVYCSSVAAGSEFNISGMFMNFCIDGACEVSLVNDNFVYMKKGILSIDRNITKTDHYYPTKRYRGLEIIFDFNLFNQKSDELLNQFGFSLKDFIKKLDPLSYKGSLMCQPNEKWMTKALSLTEALIEGTINIQKIRFTLLELLLLVSNDDSNLNSAKLNHLTQGQKYIATEVEKLISSNLEKHFTVEELAKKYKISPSSLKKYFSYLYGLPFSKYLHKARMTAAAKYLEEENFSVGQVAEMSGYQSQSKFGTVFKEYFGCSPLEYKRLHSVKKQK